MRVTKDLVAASAAPLILSILEEGESYGYALIQRVREVFQRLPMAKAPCRSSAKVS